jgi:DMSO/TMAO reductase YedYZ molybdopterin-dependent catalytic subunit
MPSLSRRTFLVSTTGAFAATGVASTTTIAFGQDGSLPAYAAWKDGEAMIVHSNNTIETRRDAIGAPSVTPTRELFVRNNLPPPSEEIVADRDAWTVAFEGVANPREMTLGELRGLGVVTVPAVLQCSGNGRAFFDHEASGTQWSVGAAGDILWTGVPLRAVIDAMGGPAEGARFLTVTGGEELPAGIDPLTVLVERSVPIEAVDEALLAYGMNGEDLSLAHGGPLRLVVPGYFGVNNVKYVKRVALTPEESPAAIQQTGYRLRPVGEKGAPTQPSMWQMSVKSWVTEPLADASSGRILIQGVAMGGMASVEGVEVSTDGGETWQEATLTGPDLGAYAWRPFALSAELQPGTYLVASRATAGGETQPETFEPNERGYGHNGWRAHAVEITVV